MSRAIPLISIVLVLILIVGGVFLWWPKYEKFIELNSDLTVKEKALSQKQEYFLKLNAISEELKKYQEELAKINSALPEMVSQPDLFDFIQKTSSENGLILKKLGSIKIFPPQSQGEKIPKISFSLSVSGSYPAFKNFLAGLYQNSRLVGIESLKFSSSKDNKDIFNFDLTVLAYYFPGTQIKEEVKSQQTTN